MKEFIQHYVDSCESCNRAKPRRHKRFGELKSLPVPPCPWTSISMDLIEFLPPSKGTNCTEPYNSILVIVDRLTKMAKFIPTDTNLTAPELARLYLTHVFSQHGLPTSIVSDRGSEFTSRFWRCLTTLLGIELLMSTAAHPETDGQTERTNQTLEIYLRHYTTYKQDDWVDLLPLAEFAYNNTTHSTMTVSPFYANYGYHPRANFTPADGVTPTANSPPAHVQVEGLATLHNHLQEEMLKAAQTAAKQLNKHRQPAPEYKVPSDYNPGDKVWLDSIELPTTRPAKKLSERYLGPFEIIEKISSHAYRLKLYDSTRIHNVFHVQLLRPYVDNDIPNRLQEPPPPLEVEGELEYEVENIMDHKINRRFKEPLRYLVKWVGYNETTWEPPSNLSNAQDIVDDYNNKNKITCSPPNTSNA